MELVHKSGSHYIESESAKFHPCVKRLDLRQQPRNFQALFASGTSVFEIGQKKPGTWDGLHAYIWLAFQSLGCSAVTILLATVGLAASFIPARRAMKIEPLRALKYE